MILHSHENEIFQLFLEVGDGERHSRKPLKGLIQLVFEVKIIDEENG